MPVDRHPRDAILTDVATELVLRPAIVREAAHQTGVTGAHGKSSESLVELFEASTHAGAATRERAAVYQHGMGLQLGSQPRRCPGPLSGCRPDPRPEPGPQHLHC